MRRRCSRVEGEAQKNLGAGGVPSAEVADAWKKSIFWGVSALLGVFLLHMETAARAVDLWSSSSAYNYAFLVIPISAYLVWEERDRLAAMEPETSLLGLVVVLLFSVSWLVADAVGINEGRQLSLVGIIQGALLTVLGVRIFRLLLFPMTYLWLLVPTGEFLVPTLQKVATIGSVWLLDVSGIPNFTEGFLIQVPAGNFLVEPGCSGLNFILSSLALSLLYGKLTYRRWRTRLVCIFSALVIAVLANIVRIYLIIALTQITDRRLNIADDHILYGWGFFAVIMLATMWFGLKFEDKEQQPSTSTKTELHSREKPSLPKSVLAVLSLIIISAPVATKSLVGSNHGTHVITAQMPENIGPWRTQVFPSDWKPVSVAEAFSYSKSYAKDGEAVDVFFSYFPYQTDEFEPKAFGNQPADMSVWSLLSKQLITLPSLREQVPAEFVSLRGPGGMRYAMVIALSGQCVTASRLISRICGAPGRYGLGDPTGAYFVVSTRGPERRQARAVISDFMSNIHPADFVADAVLVEQASLVGSSQGN